MKKSMNQQIAEDLVEQLEAGTSPFQQAGLKMPVNPTTGKTYRAMTALQLALLNKPDPRFMTLRQASNNKWKIETGSKGILINFAKTQDRVTLLDDEGNRKVNSKGKPMTQLIKLEKPIMTNAFVFNAEQVEDIPSLEEFLEERTSRHPETPQERLAKIAEKLEELMPELELAGLAEGELLQVLAARSGEALTEGPLPNPVAEEMRATMAAVFIADQLGLEDVVDPGLDFGEWMDLLTEQPDELEKIVTQAQYIADDVMKLAPKREQSLTSRADRVLQVGDVIPYNETEYEVLGKLKKNAMQVMEKESGNKFRVSPGDGIYNSLLQAKREMPKPEQALEQEVDRSMQEEHEQEQEEENDINLVLEQDNERQNGLKR
jgi:antirestriction protein ArdC